MSYIYSKVILTEELTEIPSHEELQQFILTLIPIDSIANHQMNLNEVFYVNFVYAVSSIIKVHIKPYVY